MNTILKNIIDHKKKEVEERLSLYPVKLLEKSIYFTSPCVSLKKYLLRTDKVGIIAEFKRKSPSLGVINPYASVEKVSIGYMQAGASALSVLTDKEFFGGSNEDLITARKFNYCPILRKDFVISEYQILEAKSIGADVILLLANVLTPQQVIDFTNFAHNLGLEVLLELRDEAEVSSYTSSIDVVGVNNRNLKDFSVNISQSFNLIKLLPKDAVKVSESGINDAQTLVDLKNAGYNGFLIGEAFMKTSRPEKACENFIRSVNSLLNEK